MDYFVMQQDERYTDTPVLQNIRQKIDVRHKNRLRSHQIADTTIFQVKASTDTEYLDLLSDQLYLLSEKLKKLIAMYEPECIFKYIPLMDQFNRKQSLYFLPFFEEVEALSPSSEFNADRSVIKKLVLQGEKVAKKRIFRVQESEKPLIIVRLDIAESILRRDMIGVSLKKVPIE